MKSTDKDLENRVGELEHALNESKERYRSVVDNIGIGISVISPKMEILSLNKQMRDWFPQIDISQKPICYKSFNNPPRQEVCTYCPTIKSLNDGMLHESVTNTPSGDSFINYRIIASPIKNEEGKVISVIEMVEDITIRKKSEEALKESFEKSQALTEELKNKNKELLEAHNELKSTQAQMLQREKMASIGQLAAGVAHEINNPVGFIMSNLGTLSKYVDRFTEYINALKESIKVESKEELEKLNKKLKIDFITEDSKELVKESLDGTARVNKIVQNLRSFSRVDESERSASDINDCIESTLNIVWNELKYKAKVNKDYGELSLTKCYPQQLNQVFMNLLVNASHAIEKEGDINIKTWQQGNSIFVSVSDNGQGIEEENINRIFEPFFTTKEVGKGTGLGLSIAYDIIKKHQGEITMDTQVGKGTTFTIQLPIVTV